MPGSSGRVVPAGKEFKYLRVIGRALNYCCHEGGQIVTSFRLFKGFNLKLFIHNYHS